MNQLLTFTTVAIFICGMMSCEEGVERKHRRVEVISNWPDGSVKEERLYSEKGIVEITTYFDHFKVNTKGKVKVLGDKELRIGAWESFYKNGNRWSKSEYSKGVSNGVYQTWHPNGKPNITGHYSNGVETGKWQFFDTTGTIVKEYDVTPG